MKHTAPTPRRRAAWLFLAAPALLSVPAVAQDAPGAAPPPVRVTLPQADAPPAATRVQAPPPSRESGRPVTSTAVDPQSKTVLSPGAQAALDEAKAAREARAERAAPPARQARAQSPRPAERTVRAAPRASAPETAAPQTTAAPAVTPAPVAEAPAPVAAPPSAPVETVAPAAEAIPAAPVEETAATTETTTRTERAPIWPWVALAAVIVLAGIALFARRRRRDEEVDESLDESLYVAEPVHEEPVAMAVSPAVAAAAAAPAVERVAPIVEPVAAVPVVPATPEDATVAEAEAGDVAALTAAATVKNRPWLEFAMRPVRAGTNADEALVEIELTVANAGGAPAEDVRVSTFMLTDAGAGEMERMLVDPPADAAIESGTIAPGEGTRIDATLAALKAELGEREGFTPIVVADARYRLPGGGEGRTCASFMVGVSDEGGTLLRPFDLADRVMREDVEARLHGEPQHA